MEGKPVSRPKSCPGSIPKTTARLLGYPRSGRNVSDRTAGHWVPNIKRPYSAASFALVRLAWKGISSDTYIARASLSRSPRFGGVAGTVAVEQHQGIPLSRHGLRGPVRRRVSLVDGRQMVFFGRNFEEKIEQLASLLETDRG